MGKLKKEKHDHKLTDLLKVGMFSLVMMAPFLSIGVRCGYVMWNKNAKDSYGGLPQYNDVEKLSVNKDYYFTNPITTTLQVNTSNNQFLISNLQILDYSNNGNITSATISNFKLTNNFTLRNNGSSYSGLMFTVNGTNYYIDFHSSFITFTFTLDEVTITSTIDTYLQLFKEIETNKLDNAFSYSVSQISNDPIFNWTRNTGIYTPINAMCEGLEIESDALQIMLAYWLLMTAIYIIIDIVVWSFTKITHLLINE